MIIYKCTKTGDEMFTDTYPIKEIQDILYEVEAKMVTEKTGEIDDSLIGGNASAEDPQEAASEGSSKSGQNVALAHRYTEYGYSDKKEFTKVVGTFLKRVIKERKEKNPDFDEDAFKRSHLEVMKTVLLPEYKELQFFLGESMDEEGSLAILHWKQKPGSEEDVPFFLYFKCGLKAEKC